MLDPPRHLRGYEEKGRLPLALTIRRAKQKRANSVLLFEDDAVLHPNFLELVNRIELPEDWIFYLGCQHCQRPEPFSEGLVRVPQALDAHAWAIHESAYEKLERDHLVSILRSRAIFAWKFPLGADIAQYRLHSE